MASSPCAQLSRTMSRSSSVRSLLLPTYSQNRISRREQTKGVRGESKEEQMEVPRTVTDLLRLSGPECKNESAWIRLDVL